MKKTLLLCLAALLLLVASAITASATDLLTGAMTVVAEDANMIKGAVAGDTVRFSAADFKQAMGIRRFDGITLTSLPAKEQGTLYFGGKDVAVGATVPRDSLSGLTFVPADDKVTEAAFTFTCDAYAGGAEIACTIRFAEKLNAAPTVSDVAASRLVSTYRGLSAEGTLCATDPEGDPIEFIVIEYPENGTLTMLDAATGDFRYTPTNGYTGKDEFTFVVRDIYGNYTAPASVSVSVEKRESDLDYADLTSSTVFLPALVLAENNIMLGTLEGDHMFFYPEEGVTRGEFVAMAMKAAGLSPAARLKNTVFDDNAEIPVGLRPYVATAQEKRYVIGTLSEEGLVFRADEEITRGEAAVILARILEADAPASAPLYPDSHTLPGGMRDAVMAMCAMGVYSRNESGELAAAELLDRASAAEMLYATLLASK